MGDSGGGMYFKDDGVWRLRGIVSIAPLSQTMNYCNVYDHVLFTDTSHYLDWITTDLQDEENCDLF